MSAILRLRAGDVVHELRAVARDGGWDLHVDGEVVGVEGRGALAPPARVAGASVGEHLLEIGGRLVRAVVARTADRILVAVDGHTHVLLLDDGTPGGAGGSVGTGRILAPMPGTVIQVPVSVGDHVGVGDPVAVIEAMKMETTLVSDVDGVVAAVLATPGTTVDGDALLVEITPDA
jgi:3-methylcrotonyl-CoA carboxylase alpha subunit